VYKSVSVMNATPQRRRLTSFELSDHNIHKASLTFSEVTPKAVTPFSVLANALPDQFVAANTEESSKKVSDHDSDKEEDVKPDKSKEPTYKKWSLRWFFAGALVSKIAFILSLIFVDTYCPVCCEIDHILSYRLHVCL
jgi:hypothetical protein